jgi:hypothetical protein
VLLGEEGGQRKTEDEGKRKERERGGRTRRKEEVKKREREEKGSSSWFRRCGSSLCFLSGRYGQESRARKVCKKGRDERRTKRGEKLI